MYATLTNARESRPSRRAARRPRASPHRPSPERTGACHARPRSAAARTPPRTPVRSRAPRPRRLVGIDPAHVVGLEHLRIEHAPDANHDRSEGGAESPAPSIAPELRLT